MSKRISKSARCYLEKYNEDLKEYFAKAERIALAKKRRQKAIDLTAQRRARYYAHMEMEKHD